MQDYLIVAVENSESDFNTKITKTRRDQKKIIAKYGFPVVICFLTGKQFYVHTSLFAMFSARSILVDILKLPEDFLWSVSFFAEFITNCTKLENVSA